MDILHDDKKHKFYCVIDGLEAHMEYRKNGANTLDFYHTYVPPKYRGQQVAYVIVKAAVEYAKNNDLRVIPTCPYVAFFFRRHQEYAEIVTSK